MENKDDKSCTTTIKKEKVEVKNIAAIMVLYNCQISESRTLISLNHACAEAKCTLDVYIYDNSKVAQPDYTFRNLKIIEQRHDPKNAGVSTAYNFFAKNVENSKEWLLLLDQDTKFPATYFKEIIKLTIGNLKLIVPRLYQEKNLISPHAYKFGYSYSAETLEPGTHSLKNRSVLNSGILITRQSYFKAGSYPSDVPLYFSDQVFIHRLKKNGIDKFYLLKSACKHNMASNDISNMEDFKTRYHLFLKGYRQSRKYFPPVTTAGLSTVVFMRGLKLSLRFKHPTFFFNAIKSLW